jgi:tetratricopeptide (TPR) repeat protein
MRAALTALVLIACGCLPPEKALEEAQHKMAEERYDAALAQFDRIARHAKSPRDRARALTGAAQACEKLGRLDAARLRLEQAIVPEVPGGSEVALFELAELEHLRDRARALSLYYRAAAGAQKYLNSGFPYQAASNRIIELSNSR